MNHFINVVFCPEGVSLLKVEYRLHHLDQAAIYSYIPDVIGNHTFGGVVSRVVDNRRYWMPGETVHRVQEVSNLLCRVGGVKPRPHSLLAIQNSRHTVVDLCKRGTSLHRNDGVGMEW